MLSAALTVALSLAVQDPPVAQQTPPSADPGDIAIEGIVVEGRPLEEAVRDYVDAIAAPPPGRGLAQWRGKLCMGVVNIPTDAAQYMVDRVSDIAAELGVGIGDPGCEPNAVVIFTDDASGVAQQLVERDPQAFRFGGSGLDLGRRALERFGATDAPVRWWQVSIPVNSDTGQRAVRLPGDESAPVINGPASRLSSQIRDDLYKTIVVIDVDDIANVSFGQLTDYVAMVTLAQVDPEKSRAGFTSILNVFEDAAIAESLSDWDWSYLRALYGWHPQRQNPRSLTDDVARFMARERRTA